MTCCFTTRHARFPGAGDWPEIGRHGAVMSGMGAPGPINTALFDNRDGVRYKHPQRYLNPLFNFQIFLKGVTWENIY